MSVTTACIRFAAIYDANPNDKRIRPGREFFQRGSLSFLPGHPTAPLVIEHDHDRQIGVVDALWEWQDTDGPWYVARAQLTGDPPLWLKRGAKASFSFIELQHQAIDDWTRVLRAFVKEISVLHTQQPVEPRAQVLLVERSKDSPAVATSDVAGEIIYGKPGELIRRPGIGQMLGVR
jgi:hypothetical protein